MKKIKNFFISLAVGLVLIVAVLGGAVSDRIFGYRILDRYFQRKTSESKVIENKILNEESVVIDVVEKASPSVVTIGIKKTQTLIDPFQNFFDPFDFFGGSQRSQPQQQKIEQNIATGFIVSKDGLIVTNKHVVDDTEAKYKIMLNDKKEYDVKKIYRDPANDLAILKIEPLSGSELMPLQLGDSSKLKVGQLVIAIGTLLGEFPNSVTKGIISGLGRGISAGSPFEGMVERLDDVIQTDAAINPGNSGGPLLNSAGQVIGVNVAMAEAAQNIAFAIPINVVKEMIDVFNKTGQFSRPFLGIRYRMITKQEAMAKDWVEGAGVIEVIKDSPAEKAGIEIGDIITKIDGQKLSEKDGELAKIIAAKKVGERMTATVWRDNQEKNLTVLLEEFSQ